MELTVASLIGELGLSLVSGQEAAHAHVRFVHSTELADPTPWLKGGELLLSTGLQLAGPKAQREFIDRLEKAEVPYVLTAGTGLAFLDRPDTASSAPGLWEARVSVQATRLADARTLLEEAVAAVRDEQVAVPERHVPLP